MKLRTLMVFLVAAVSASTVLLTGFSMISNLSSSRDNAVSYAESLIDVTASYLSEVCSELKSVGDMLRGNKMVQRYLLEAGARSQKEQYEDLLDLLRGAVRRDDTIAGIAIYNDRCYRSTSGACLHYYQNPALPEGEAGFTAQYSIDSGYVYRYIYLVLPIYDTHMIAGDWTRQIGTMVICVQSKDLEKLLARFLPVDKIRLMLVDAEGNWVYATKQAELPDDFPLEDSVSSLDSVTILGDSCVYVERHIDDINLTLRILWPESDLRSGSQRIVMMNLIIFAISMAIILGIVLVLYRNIVRPVGEIVRFSEEWIGGVGPRRLRLQERNELHTVADCFNRVLDENEVKTGQLLEAQSQLYEAQLAHNKAQLSSLQAQINPHYLYNTLESICAMADLRGVSEISEIAVAMAQVFRYSISGDVYSTLGDELACIRAYFKVIQVRFADRFTIRIDCPEALLKVPLLRMMLQPLVENAVKHGLEKKRGRGNVFVQCRRQGEQLVLAVCDDGCGMDAERLEEVRRAIDLQHPSDAQESIGLPNILRRMKSCYEDVDFRIDSAPDEGTRVEIRISRGKVDWLNV